MENNNQRDNYIILIDKIIDYLANQQEKNNVNEKIPYIDGTMAYPDFINLKPNDAFNEYINDWNTYFDFRALISKEFLEELQKGLIRDGIFIADLNLCKKRVVQEDSTKGNYGCVRITDSGIYFEGKTNSMNK